MNLHIIINSRKVVQSLLFWFIFFLALASIKADAFKFSSEARARDRDLVVYCPLKKSAKLRVVMETQV
jgi:hypothetical protein